jgi:ADP-L-glycero-D-manno-heptose 6-epimerase
MVIVTGANGFIGSALVWELNQAGRKDVVCVDTVLLKERADLLQKRSYQKFLGKDDIWAYLETPEAIAATECILHMGACSTTTELNVAFLNENNVEYTRRLWNWCTKHKKTFIYASSAAVYGDGANGFDDSAPTERFQPLNPYGESKAAFDRWVETQIADQQPTPPFWLGLRFFNVFGPNEYHKGFMCSVPFKAFGQIRDSGKMTLFRSHNSNYADGKQMRDFVYVKDVTRWILELMSSKTAQSGIYNMGFGKARPWLDLANAVFKTMERPAKIEWTDIPEAMRPRYQYFTEAKMARLFAQGASQPQWPLEKAIDDYVRNYLSKGVAKSTPGVDAYL